MKKIPSTFKLCLMLSLLFAATGASAQARFGYVDMKRVLDEAPQVAAGRAKLDAEFRARSVELRAMEDQLDQLEQELFSAAGADDRDDLQQRVGALRRDVRDTREDLAEDINIRLNEELARVEEDIHAAIEELGRERGYDLIFSSPVEYASDRVDLTDEVLERLAAMHRQAR